MYYSESMIQMVEDLHRQASEMEKEVKGMMELEGRALGIELDKRKSVRDLYNELNAHSQAKAEESQAMTWAYVPCDMAEQDPNCYPADSYIQEHVEMPVEEHVEHVEEHVEHEVEVPAEPVLDSDGFVIEEPAVEPAPVELDLVVEEAPVDVPVEPAPEAPAEGVEPIAPEAPAEGDDNPPSV